MNNNNILYYVQKLENELANLRTLVISTDNRLIEAEKRITELTEDVRITKADIDILKDGGNI